MHQLELRVPPVLILLILAIIMWFGSVFVPLPTTEIHAHITIVALFVLSGSGMVLVNAISFYRVGTTVNPMQPEFSLSLVMTGIYRFSRNPMYLGLAVFLLGWGIYLGYVIVSC